MTLQQKQAVMSKAIEKSMNGQLTYALIKDNQFAITQSGSTAYRYVNDYGFKLCATFKDGTMTL